MVPNLDDLIEWLLDEVASRGKDGVSISKLLALIDSFHHGPKKQTGGGPAGGRSPAGRGNPKLDHEFVKQVWESLAAHPDVLVGEDKPATARLGHPEDSFPNPLEGSAFLVRGPEDPSSPSTQLLGQVQPEAAELLPVCQESITSINGGAQVTVMDSSQPPSPNLEPGNHADGRTNNDACNASSYSMNDVPKNDEKVDMAMIHAQHQLGTTDSVNHDSESDEILSLFTQALGQPRIYVSQDRRRKNITPSSGTSRIAIPDFETLANTPKRRGRPPKIRTNDSSRGQSQPSKAKAASLTLSYTPRLPGTHQKLTTESSGRRNTVNLESSPEPKNRRGRQPGKAAVFTSHDESQRAAGTPGVYFDIIQPERTAVGRPKKKKIALFKSEKLKNLLWMGGNLDDVHPMENAAIGGSTRYSMPEHGTTLGKRSRDPELQAANAEPNPKKLLLDGVHNFGSSHLAPYKSPYLSLPATSYVSPYAPNASITNASATWDGPLITPPDGMSILGLKPSSSAAAVVPALIPAYESPHMEVQLTKLKLLDSSSTSSPNFEQPFAAESSQSTKHDELEAAIKIAEDLAIPNVAIRLPSSNGGVAGNLCLSADKKFLAFVTNKTRTETAAMTIQVSDVTGPPETSEIGSEIMKLTINAYSANGEEEIHCFRFLPTDAAYRNANNMRAKIVTSMMLLDLEDNAKVLGQEKPFRCDGCDGAWKNWEGLKYHQTKSKSFCNPNYKPGDKSINIAGQDILGLAAAALDVLNGDVSGGSPKSSFPEGYEEDSVIEQESTQRSTHTVVGIKSRGARSDSEIQRGKEVIISLLDANEQVFPSEESLWFAFVAATIQIDPDSDLPSYDTCKVALNLLADTGQVRKVQFSFKDKTGLMRMRTLITRHDVDPTSAVVIAIKENIKAVFPDFYVPLGFGPSKEVRARLDEQHSRLKVVDSARKGQRLAPVSQAHKSWMKQVPGIDQIPFDDSPSEKITRSGRISRRPERLQQSTMESSIRHLEDAIRREDDDSCAEELSNQDSPSRALSSSANNQRKRRKPSAFKTSIMGPDPTSLPKTVENKPQHVIDSDSLQRKRLKNGIQAAEAVFNCKARWQPATTFLQGRNGAWSFPTLPRLIRRKYAPRTGLPEPVTYLQTSNNSAWNFRPYGHGVRPIHARPSKRAEGQTVYLTRIQHGFRPVIMPNGEIFIPSTLSSKPTDQSLETAIDGVPNLALSAGQKQTNKSGSSSTLSSQDRVTEVFPQPAGPTVKKRKYRRQTPESSKVQSQTLSVTAKRRRVKTPNESSLISTARAFLSQDESSMRGFSISSDSGHLRNSIGQIIPNTSRELGSVPTLYDDCPREEKAWDTLQRVPTAQYMMTARRLTALPADLEGIEESLANHSDLKVEVAVDHQHNIRRRTKEGAISTDAEYRLMVAVVVIRTLTGGLDKQIDWVLVSKLFPDLPMNAVSKRWPKIYTKHNQMVERLGTDFQEYFLEAYERGEVRPIDYDHLVDYDWNSLVDLVIERIDINPNKTTTHQLPALRSDLNQMFTMNNAENNKAWRDDYFGLQPAVYKRMEHAASEQFTMATYRSPLPNLEMDVYTVAKSWVRANTLTPSESYDKDFAAHKLATIGNEIVAAATSALFESKVLMQRNKGRPTPNRGVEITDNFASALRKHLDETHLTQAAAFKASLDAKFRAGEVAMVEWAAKDGDILAITNLQAHGRIKIEPKGVPMNRFGLTGGGYQTKRMDKANLRFDMHVLPTATYVFDVDMPMLSSPTPEMSPPRGIAGAIPAWCDIGEKPIPALWKKVVCAVLSTIAMRPGAVLAELARIFAPALEVWELRVLINWGLGIGALIVLRDGHEGWNVAEWWWVIGGRA